VSFVGAAGGDVEVRTTVIRQGKAMTFIRGDLASPDGKLGTTALFAFGASRASACTCTAPLVEFGDKRGRGIRDPSPVTVEQLYSHATLDCLVPTLRSVRYQAKYCSH